MLVKVAISWPSRAQKVTAAATSESGYVALAGVLSELRFLRQVEAFMVPPMDREMAVHEDNEGTVKVANNRFSSRRRRTRHIDVSHHIVRDAVDEGVAKIDCAKSGQQHDALTELVGIKCF